MAVSSRTWDEAVDRWSRVGELGMEAALREIACPELGIAKALEHNNETSFYSEALERRSSVRVAGRPTSSMSGGLDLDEKGDVDSNDSEPYRYTELERSTILATVGRGISGVQKLSLKDTLTENELTAVCVNLTSNINIRSLQMRFCGTFCGSCTGCTLLGNAFATNPAIHAFDFIDVGVGSEAVSCLLKGLQLSKTLKNLDLSDNPLGDEGVRSVGEFLGTANSTLRSLDLRDVDMTSAGVRFLLKWPAFCSTLENLKLTRNPLGDDGVSWVAEFLANSTTLKSLELQNVGCGLEGAKHLASALTRNTSLEELSFGFYRSDYNTFSSREILETDYVENFGVILGALSRNEPTNRSLRSLRLCFSNIFEVEYPAYLQALTSLITMNRTLTGLSLREMKLPLEIWKERFFPALKENTTLEWLDLSRCGGLSADVLETAIDIFQNSNTALENLGVRGTGLENYSAQIDEELRINKEYRSALSGQPLVSTTSGRVVLCGFEFGGKTEICNTMQQIDKGTGPHSLKMLWKRLMQKFPTLQRMLFGKDAYRELSSRTRGCDMLVLENHLPLKSIWDFAGQKEYYALHDYIFPDMNNSCFLFVCSCRDLPDSTNPKGKIKDKESMRRECEHWLKFLASNSKVRIGKDGHGRQLLCVIFVLTKRDSLPSHQLAISKANAKDVVKDLGRLFDGVLDLGENVEVVDGRSAEDIKDLLKVVRKVLGKTLENKTEYVVCEKVREVLGKWSAANKSKPVLKLDEYYKLCQADMTSPNPLIPLTDGQGQSRAGRDVVLTYLNDVGEIISLKGLGFIITNPRWFGVGVLGSLINAFKGTEERTGLLKSCRRSLWDLPEHDGGFVDRETLEILLGHSLKTLHLKQPLTTEQLTDLMLELEMCHRKDPTDEESSLFMPALFDDPTDSAVQGKRQLQWKLKEEGPFICLGRRLSCEDKSKTFLTPGFFPRWQVRMLNLLHEKGWASNSAFQIGRNLIGFTQNGIEVLIEYSGDVGYFVDILVKSFKPYADALKFIEKFMVQNIRQFCASPQGCQGVVLVASVIRPVCVQKLDKCFDRRDQCVLISFLEEQRASDPAYTHTWNVPRRGPGMASNQTSYALDLLEGEGSFVRRHKLVADRKSDIASSSGSSSRSGDDLPKLIYPSITDVGMVRKLVTTLNLRKKMAIKLHLLCDNKDGSHEVEKQPGRTYILNWKDSGVDLPIAKHLVMLLSSALGVGATMARTFTGVPLVLPSIEGLVKLIDAPEMLAIDVQTLNQKLRPGQALVSPSKEDICALLTSYMESDPHALGLKKFLNLADSDKFWSDFQLRKVVYREASHEGKIGWVCDECYWDGFNEGILASAPLT